MLMKRIWRSILACVCVLSLVFVPSANADMRGFDVSNWQCDLDTYALDADFVVAGATSCVVALKMVLVVMLLQFMIMCGD